jgi:hypothetical protein
MIEIALIHALESWPLSQPPSAELTVDVVIIVVIFSTLSDTTNPVKLSHLLLILFSHK